MTERIKFCHPSTCQSSVDMEGRIDQYHESIPLLRVDVALLQVRVVVIYMSAPITLVLPNPNL